MITKKVIITGGTGFLGEALATHLSKEYRVIVLTRQHRLNEKKIEYVRWDGQHLGYWTSALEGAFSVINLAGKSVDCRYNLENKQAIYNSRLDSTYIIGKAIEQCKIKPKVWINAASATIYRHSLDDPMTEDNGAYGTGFSVDVCKKWETCFFSFNHRGVRQIALRTAIVLGKSGGVMTPLRNLVKLGLGGKQGRGNQLFSWIHVDDFCRATRFLMENESSSGVYNIAAPNPITNKTFMKSLRKQLKIPFGLPIPKWLLELGAKIIKTETELILKSRFVVPKKLLLAGFHFRHQNIDQCLLNT